MSLLSLPVSEQLGQALGWMVVHSLWQATAVALLAGVTFIVLRHRSAALRYWVGNGALLCILLLAAGTFVWYYVDAPQGADAVPRQAMATQLVSAVQPQDGGGAAWPFLDTLARHDETAAAEQHFSLATLQDYTRQNLPLIVTVWFLGVTFFLLRLLGSVSYIYYLRGRMNFPPDPYWDEMLQRLSEKMKFEKAVSLVESALVRSPLTLGHLKPMILFPIGVLNRLSEQEVEAILAHELAHIVRRDYLFNIIQSFVEALFYYHPAVWWLSAQVRNERESACDEMAISLTGDKIAYAKALVTIQEMAYFPLTTALAFAGQRRSQFLMRMQRILQHTTIKRNVMEKIVATALIVGTVLVLSFAQDRGDVIVLPPSVVDAGNADSASDTKIMDMPLTGIWQSEEKDGELCITFNSKQQDSHWMNDLCLRQDKPSIPTSEGPFSIAREAGVMELTGKKDGNEGYGKFRFVPSADFKKYLEGRGMTGVTDGLLMHCFFSNINRAYFDFLSKQGYTTVTTQQLQDLAMFRMEPETINTYRDIYAKGGSGVPTLEDMAQMRIHGIDADYIAELSKMGYRNLSADEVMQLKVHNIDTMFVMGLRRAGYGNLSLDDLLQLRMHDVDGLYANKVNTEKRRRLSVDELIDSKISVPNIGSPAEVEMPIDSEDPVEGEVAYFNIDKGYADMMNNLGVGHFSYPELQAARSLVLDKTYIVEMQRANVTGLNPPNLLAMKGLGIDTRTVRKYKEMGISMAAEELIEAQSIGVDEDFIRWSWSIGCESRDLGDFVACKNRLNNQSGNGGSTGRGRSNSSGNGNTGYYGNADDNGNIGYVYTTDDNGGTTVNVGPNKTKAQRDAAKKKKEEQEYNIFGTFICMMMDDGLIKAGQSIRISVTHTGAKLNGRSLTTEQYRRYYNAAKANSGGSLPATFECRLTGEIHGCDGTSFQMTGQMNTNFGN